MGGLMMASFGFVPALAFAFSRFTLLSSLPYYAQTVLFNVWIWVCLKSLWWFKAEFFFWCFTQWNIWIQLIANFFRKKWVFFIFGKVFYHLIFYFFFELFFFDIPFCKFFRYFENLLGLGFFVEFGLLFLKISDSKLKLRAFLHLLFEIL